MYDRSIAVQILKKTKPNPTKAMQIKSHSNMIGIKNENILNDLLILDWDTIWTEMNP